MVERYQRLDHLFHVLGERPALRQQLRGGVGDDLIDARDELLAEMLRVQQHTGGSVVALMEVEPEKVSSYGVASVEESSDGGPLRITGLVEKPAAEDAPSNLAVIGRYVLHPAVFEVLERTGPGRGGEIQLTDALATLVEPFVVATLEHGMNLHPARDVSLEILREKWIP